MATVTIGSETYDVYADVAEADAYLAADFGRAAAWDDLDTDEKSQALVTSTRRFDRLKWQGTMTDPLTPQPLDFPRNGLVDCEGMPLPDGTTPIEITNGSIIFAADISIKPSLSVDSSTDSNLKRVKAGSVEVEFFRAQGGVILPKDVFELVSCFLAGTEAGAFFFATGTDVPSQLDGDINERYGRDQGFA